MTRDEIIAMARGSEWLGKYESATGFSAECAIKFAKLVAQHEREACAKLCWSQRKYWDAEACADAIRAMGKT